MVKELVNGARVLASTQIYLSIYVSVTKAKLVSTSPLEVPREPSNVWFEFLDLGTVTIGFLVKF